MARLLHDNMQRISMDTDTVSFDVKQIFDNAVAQPSQFDIPIKRPKTPALKMTQEQSDFLTSLSQARAELEMNL